MADPLSRLSSMLNSARDLTLEAAVSASSRLTETPAAHRPQQIAKLLRSRIDAEVLSGMKCVLGLMARGEDATPYFADVVKNVTSDNARVRASVSVYLQKYAEAEPDTALLSINSVQKRLGDKAPVARAAAIRTLGGIRIPEIASLVVLCIRRAAGDSAPEVRAGAALAIGKAWRVAGADRKQLARLLSASLDDSAPQVVAAALKVFRHVQRDLAPKIAWAPLHRNFRRYTRMSSQLDEWAQGDLVDMLAAYGRRFLPRPSLSHDGTTILLPEAWTDLPESARLADGWALDSDLTLFLESLAPLAYARSPALVLSAVRAIVSVGTPAHLVSQGFDRVLVKMACGTGMSRTCALQAVQALSAAVPELFRPSACKFFVSPGDDADVVKAKLEVLSALGGTNVIRELQHCAIDGSPQVARGAVRALGVAALADPTSGDRVLRWCLREVHRAPARDVLTVVRLLLQREHSQRSVRAVYRLAQLVTSALDEDARASIVWIVGEFTSAADNTIAPDVLRRMLPEFASQPRRVRLELLMLAAKCYVFELQRREDEHRSDQFSRVQAMFLHTMHLARYDTAFDTRDRARMLTALMDAPGHELAALFLQAPKPAPHASSQQSWAFFACEPWADQSTLPSSSVRAEREKPQTHASSTHFSSAQAKQTGVNAPALQASQPTARGKLQSLDEFFGDSDDESESAADSQLESESEEELDSGLVTSESESESESGSDSESDSESEGGGSEDEPESDPEDESGASGSDEKPTFASHTAADRQNKLSKHALSSVDYDSDGSGQSTEGLVR